MSKNLQKLQVFLGFSLFRYVSSTCFFNPFWTGFCQFFVDFSIKNRRKNDTKSYQKNYGIFSTFFHRFWKILGPKKEPYCIQNRSEINFLSENAKSLPVLEILLVFQQRYFPWAYKSNEKSIKNQWKIEVKMRRPLNINFSLFFEDFWVPRRCKTAPGFAQDLSRRPRTPPRTRKIDWKSAQEILQSRLEGILEVSRRPPVAQKRPRTAQSDSRLRF